MRASPFWVFWVVWSKASPLPDGSAPGATGAPRGEIRWGKLLFGFGRNAALAATATGRLQIQRFAKQDGREVLATDNPAEAFQYLGLRPHWL